MAEFSWIPFYQELADALLGYRPRQAELLEFLNGLRASGLPITPFTDRDEKRREIALEEIDPFTFFAVFNRKITEKNRFEILAALKARFGVVSLVPQDLTGIPLLHPMNSWFFDYKRNRRVDAIARLWDLFVEATKPDAWSPALPTAFDHAVEAVGAGKVTIGLYWVRPNLFLPLDKRTCEHLKIEGVNKNFRFADYRSVIDGLKRSDRRPFAEISRDAYERTTQSTGADHTTACWLVGAWWYNADPPDRTEDFLRSGVWRNGYKDKYLDLVKLMKPGDRIAIKAATTQSDGLPFEYPKAVSKMVIKARGVVTANRANGRDVEVEWDQEFVPRDWYFYTYRPTVWKLDTSSEYGALLAAFVFEDKLQDIPFFVSRWLGAVPVPSSSDEDDSPVPYSKEEAVSGVFIEPSEFDVLLNQLKRKKNLILQGAPGVGKTFLAKRLAYSLLGEKDDARVQFIQFHQSYSYEDFVQGFRPSLGDVGAMAFTLRNGIFHEFCSRARETTEPHVLVIDEINRGNLSRIFGELMVLIEADKPGEKHALRLAYQAPEEPRFFVPENLYVLGLMNLADRSLALVDYALRRRFAFRDLHPQFGSKRYRDWLTDRGVSPALLNRIITRLGLLNEQISKDPQLGPHFCVGHSYFCPYEDQATPDEAWYSDVVESEVAPLLREYWYDDTAKATDAIRALLA